MNIKYHFQPKWKEELHCSCSEGTFVLVHPMGVPTVNLPSEKMWSRVAPEWAWSHWNVLHDQLQEWCSNNGIDFAIDQYSEYPLVTK